MKKILLLTLFAGGFFLTLTTFGWASDDLSKTQVNVGGDTRGLEHVPSGRLVARFHNVPQGVNVSVGSGSASQTGEAEPNDESDPDKWGQGEVILGGGHKPSEEAVERAKKLFEENEEWRRKWKELWKLYDELIQKLKDWGLYEEGWRVNVDPEGHPFIESPFGERLLDTPKPVDPENSDPDDWGQGEKIL